MRSTLPRAVVSAILQKKVKGKTFIYLQERWKPKVCPVYSGLWEIPAGCVDSYENVYDALKREVKEECGLDIVRVINDFQSKIYQPNKIDRSFVFKPLICQEVLSTDKGLPWIGFVFLCEVKGKIKIDKKEARRPRWVSLVELKKMVTDKPRTFFPLQLPVLKYYLDNFKGIK